jgi:hypothetical protein
VPFLDGADLNSSEKSLLQKICVFSTKFIVSLTHGSKKTLGHIVIAVMKETESSQESRLICPSKSAINPVHAWKRSGVENLGIETP